MTAFAFVLLFFTAIGMLALPRQWALLPLLIGACYMTNAQNIDIGPFHFTVLRILLLIGAIRSVIRKETLPGGFKGLDKIILAWGLWFVFSSVFHKPFTESLVTRLGVSYNVIGIYFLIRIFCRNKDDLIQIIKLTAFVLTPVALEMINEKVTHKNWFGFLGGVPPEVVMRDDKLRAQGPFGHAILAGTVGATCLPLMIGIWRLHPKAAKLGVAACLTIVVTSNSSGPLMSFVFALCALFMWRWRRFIPTMRISAVVFYLICNVLMTRPAYFLLEKIDLTGSSSSYHRAAIIDAAVNNWRDWIVGGTDYTRHWMPYGVSFSPNHSDITNHYIWYGVDGGLPAMALFIAAVWLAYRYIRQSLEHRVTAPFADQFLIWSAGACLFAHTASMISIAYFDQSVTFLYLNLAVIGSLHAATTSPEKEASPPVPPLRPNLMNLNPRLSGLRRPG